MSKICLNCGHKKGCHKVYFHQTDRFEQCSECNCMNFFDIKEYPKFRQFLVKKKMNISIDDYDDKYKQRTGKEFALDKENEQK